MSSKPVVYIVLYSLYHHVYKLALSLQEGLESKGVQVQLFQVAESLSDDILDKMQAPAKPDLPIITVDKLAEPDGILFGLPTRFGVFPAQIKSLLDASGALWAKGALVGKFAGTFFSTASQHGGQETTALTAVTYFAHQGMLYVPFGFADPALSNNTEVIGGSAYGAGTITNGDGSRQPSPLELEIAKHQGENFATIVSTFVKGKSAPAGDTLPPLKDDKSITDNGAVPATDKSTVPATDSGAVPVTDNGTVPATGNGTAPATDNSTVPVTTDSTAPTTDKSVTAPTDNAPTPSNGKNSSRGATVGAAVAGASATIAAGVATLSGTKDNAATTTTTTTTTTSTTNDVTNSATDALNNKGTTTVAKDGTNVLDTATTAAQDAKGTATTTANNAKDSATGVLNTATTPAYGAKDEATTAASGFKDTATTSVNGAVNDGKGVLNTATATTTGSNAATTGGKSVKDSLTATVNNAKGSATTTVNNAKDSATTTANSATTAANNAKDSATTVLNNAKDSTTAAVNKVTTATAGTGTTENAKKIGKEAGETAAGAVSSVPTDLKDNKPKKTNKWCCGLF